MTAEFVLTSTVAVFTVPALLQLAFALHVRNVLIDAASHGARYGTLADRGPADAQERTRELITGSVGARFAGDVTAVPAEVQGAPTLEVRVVAPLPIVGPFGPPGAIEVSGHAVDWS